MKVLALIPGEELGSSMIFSKRQVNQLIEKGINVKTFFLSSRTSLSVLYSELKRFRKEITLFKPDIIHCHYGTVTAMFGTLSTTIPKVITYHGSDLNIAKDVHWTRSYMGHIFSQVAALFAKRIICVSSKLKSRLWWHQSKAEVIPVGVDEKKFFPTDKQKARAQLQWDQEKFYILFNANNPIVKRLDIAENIEKELKKIDARYNIHYVKGFTPADAMPLLLNASDALLMCSDTEGSPALIKEAMACNLPIVSNDIGDIAERLNGVKMCTVVERNGKLMAEKLHEIISMKERSNGREVILKEGLTEDDIADKIISIYNSCIM